LVFESAELLDLANPKNPKSPWLLPAGGSESRHGYTCGQIAVRAGIGVPLWLGIVIISGRLEFVREPEPQKSHPLIAYRVSSVKAIYKISKRNPVFIETAYWKGPFFASCFACRCPGVALLTVLR
jgi:hypothetical protein